MNTLTRETIANAAVILRLRPVCTPDDVNDELALLVIATYKDQYNVIPTLWVEYMRESLACKYVLALIEQGYDPADLAVMPMPELRDLYQDFCLKSGVTTIITATPNGGTSVKRVA